jgi:quinolinate synthase
MQTSATIARREVPLQEALAATAPIYHRLRHLIPEVEWAAHAPLIVEIERLKRERNAVILAHNYQTPEIFHGVADITGDSLALARRAAESEAEVIVVCGVHFMAETAKLLNPERTVLIPDPEAGCSLAESITAADVRALRARHPGVPVVTYVNTSAEVKAETDVCCTSANAVEVVESLGAERVIFLPDRYLGRWVAANTSVEIIGWDGTCEVHEQFTVAEIELYRRQFPGVKVIAHPECDLPVLEAADMVGSTSGMIRWVAEQRPQRVVMVTECSMSDNVAAEFPDIEFVRPCTICPHMKRITLAKIAASLEHLQHPVEVPSRSRAGAAGGRTDARGGPGRARMNRDRFHSDELRVADVLVVGGGVAGLSAALHARGRRVLLVLGKTAFAGGGSSVHAQGGVAAALDPGDSPARHAEDTMAAGGGPVRRGGRAAGDRRGSAPHRRAAGVGRAPSTAARRHARARERGRAQPAPRGARRGRRHRPRDGPRPRRGGTRESGSRSWTTCWRLELVRDRGAVAGVAAVDRHGPPAAARGPRWCSPPAASAPCGSAPPIPPSPPATAWRWRSAPGPRSPTSSSCSSTPPPSTSAADTPAAAHRGPARRGRAARRPARPPFHARGAPGGRARAARRGGARDLAAAARGRRGFLDATAIAADLEERFPTVVGLCRAARLRAPARAGAGDPRRPLPHGRGRGGPRRPHHGAGAVGLRRGRAHRLHGANRLASNSLLEALVYGAAVGEALAAGCRDRVHPLRARDLAARAAVPVAAAPWLDGAAVAERAAAARLRELMWAGAGLERDAAGLRRAAAGLSELAAAAPHGRSELDNMLLVASLVVRAAAARTESRGAHLRADFPSPAGCWRQPLVFEGGRMLQPRPMAHSVST